MIRAILIVDGNPTIRAALSELLAREPGVQTSAVADAAEAEASLSERRADLLILSTTGRDDPILALGRHRGADAPRHAVLLLVPAGDEAAIEDGLSGCADDLLGKPFRIATLLGRVRRLLRDLPDPDSAAIALGPYLFHPAQRVLHEADTDRRIRLTEKEAAILLHLHQAGGPVDRAVLLHEVWGYNDQVSTHTLETHIYKLRQKIEPYPSDARLLLTEGGGYRLASTADPPPES